MTANLILTIIALLFVLVGLVTLYVWNTKTKRRNISASPEPHETLESLSDTITDPASSNKELHHAINMILKHYGSLNAGNIEHYKRLLQALCTHPHTDSAIILKFEKTLRMNNAAYGHDLEKSLGIGLASRG